MPLQPQDSPLGAFLKALHKETLTQWLTMQYVLLAYDEPVANKMEWVVSWINRAIIFIGAPVATALWLARKWVMNGLHPAKAT